MKKNNSNTNSRKKIIEFGSEFSEKSRKKINPIRDNNQIKSQINLIYDSKLKSDATGRFNRRKTRNLNPKSHSK